MAEQKHLLIDADSGLHVETFQIGSAENEKPWSVELRRLHGGVSEGVGVLEVRTDRVRCEILPTRGMGLWRATLDGVPLGWQSPLGNPVHPAYVPLSEPSGVGFLDGITELMFRCGLESNGAPEFNAEGRLRYPLHGRIANTPACFLAVEVNADQSIIRVTGQVAERRFLGQKLLLTTQYVIDAAQGVLQWTDTVKNIGASPATMQMLYHINLGKPFLAPGARVEAPAVRVCPRDEAAVQGGVADWAVIPQQRAEFSEQVYFLELAGDAQGRTSVVLQNAAGAAGVELGFCLRELPWFTVWKNSQSDEDGFVAGLEPGTNLPNQRSFEEGHGRVVSLPPGAQWQTQVRLRGLATEPSVREASLAAVALLNGGPTELAPDPAPGWSASA
ncbi:hypothetical protein Pla175_14030 [Pirellulimonas nuda]|uniref:Aldose 1-epimerase n=1 Tax=Pirellulimonas nuda TaxID=2528009 RepID=A0A518D986_9BACT|nr:DUF4432 family protein [Pirellulimonas nuda]QDU88033.1 hypothetical protein Pla175_14030 [Pirellulimonas nuda]